jgi:hypothetical protein
VVTRVPYVFCSEERAAVRAAYREELLPPLTLSSIGA